MLHREEIARAKASILRVAPNLTDEELAKRAIRKLCYTHDHALVLFGILFDPGDTTKNTLAPFHYRYAKRLEDESHRLMANVMPRGHAKTTWSQIYVTKRLSYTHVDKSTWELYPPEYQSPEREFILWISKTFKPDARDALIDIRTLLMSQELIYYFGDQMYEPIRDTEGDIITRYDNRILSKGMNQQIRGGKYKNKRYTLIIGDDMEGEENTKTEESRDQNKRKILGAILPSVGEPPDKGRFIMNGTIVHKQSFLQEIVNTWRDAKKHGRSIEWDVMFERATNDGQLTDTSKSLWPDRFPLARLRQIRQGMIDAGKGSMFSQEYMNNPRDESNIAITEQAINDAKAEYHFFLNNDGDGFIKYEGDYRPVFVFLGVDPASTLSSRSDYSVVVPVAIDNDSIAWVLPYFHDRVRPMEHAEKIFEFNDQYNPKKVNIETIAYQEMLRNYLELEQRRRNTWIRGIGPKSGIKGGKMEKKWDRIGGILEPRFSSRSIKIMPHMQELIQQLIDWDQSLHDDIADGLYLALKESWGPSQGIITNVEDDKPYLEKSRRKTWAFNWMTGASR